MSDYRDKLVWNISSFLFNHFASKEYRDKLTIVIMAGLDWLSQNVDNEVDK